VDGLTGPWAVLGLVITSAQAVVLAWLARDRRKASVAKKRAHPSRRPPAAGC
jgi:hypothetical protein